MISLKRSNGDTMHRWCVILNPVESELVKAETIEKIVELFPLSLDEAAQLVERTPIILLENLNYELAKKVQSYFAAIHTDIILTDDAYLKRKCYRTVWPQDPLLKLREIERPGTSVSSHESSQKEGAESPRLETRAESPSAPLRDEVRELHAQIALLQEQKEQLAHELERAKHEHASQQLAAPAHTPHEFEYLSLELEKAKQSLSEKEGEIASLMSDLEKTYSVMTQLKKETEARSGTQADVHALQEEIRGLHARIRTYEEAQVQSEARSQEFRELQAKYEELKHEVHDHALKKTSYEDLEKHYEELERKLKERESEVKKLKEQMSLKQGGLEDLKRLQDEVKGHVTELKRRQELLDRLQVEKNQLKTLLEDLQRDNEELRQSKVQYKALENKYEYLEEEMKELVEAKNVIDSLEIRCDELAQSLDGYKSQSHEMQHALTEKEQKIGQLKTELEELHLLHENEVKRLTHQLETIQKDAAMNESACTRLTHEKESMRETLEKLEKDNEELQTMSKHYTELEQKYTYLDEQMQEYTQLKTELRAREAAYEKVCAENKQKEVALHEAKELISDCQAKIQEYEDLTHTLREEQALMRADADKQRYEHERVIREQESLIEEQEKRIQELDAKAKKLLDHNEMLQRTNKELTIRKEEQETMERRMKLQQEISVKEQELKSLVSNQQNLEKDIVEKGQKIKEVVTNQETIEKDLVRMKQELKHLFEKMKFRDKQKTVKRPDGIGSRMSIIAPDGDAKEEINV